ncbi:MAG TPA: hypothetical protein VIK38_07725 [Coriobacteriia bacterium]
MWGTARSGLPGIRPLKNRARRLQLEGYVQRVIDRDIPDDAGVLIRDPAALRRWMNAYAAATSTTATFETLRNAASAGESDKSSKDATQAYPRHTHSRSCSSPRPHSS